jgi:predicted nucleic acid-binding protein
LIRYFDASALAKRYVAEPESKEVARLLLDDIAVTCRLSETEIASALARRQREGRLTAATRDRLLASMQRDLASLYVVEVSPEVSELGCRLLMRHKLRAADALHLASALFLSRRSESNIQFVAFDQALNEAAHREGLALPAI